LFIDDAPILTVMDARTKARRLKAERKDLGLIVIDYIQLMQGSKQESGGNRTQEISEISRGLKTLARELNVPIIALSQLSRSVEARQNKRPMLSDLRESGAIEQDADMVMFLYRHEYYEPDDTEHRGECEVIIAKQRNGPVGMVKLLFHGATTKFKNLEPLH
jgi:replicative DNA helicase